MSEVIPLLSKIAIWAAIAGWTAAIIGRYLDKSLRTLNILWLVSLIFFSIHVITAFHGFYQWSIQTALTETARLTEQVTGWRSGIGLWVNFVFFAWLAADYIDRVRKGEKYSSARNRIAEAIILFMILNGAVIFATGPVRWFGAALLLSMGATMAYAKFRPD
ncbi:MAG: hypothetical protein P1U89_20185 [Verrucomicrobiales bacterium]|nr:hypothetical protein [Verrucomicrobiales bacterium]